MGEAQIGGRVAVPLLASGVCVCVCVRVVLPIASWSRMQGLVVAGHY